MIHRSTKFKNEDECKQEHNCKNKLDDEIKQDIINEKINQLQTEKADVIIRACDEILRGNFNEYFVVDPFQGGAGTSTNMNVNEVVANRAIELLGGEKGDYDLIHPLNHVNHFQSTNDVYPTALRIASINLLRKLSSAFASLQEALQKKENEFSDIITRR